MRRSPVATGSASRASTRGRFVHILVGVLGWAAFDALALWQFTSYAPANLALDLKMLAACAAGFWLGGIAWVRWNRDIHRRRHRRTAPIVQPVDFTRDVLGRPVAAAGDLLDEPGRIVVCVDPVTGVKFYRRLEPAGTEDAPAALPQRERAGELVAEAA